MSPKRAARGDKFARVAEERRLLSPNEIAWRDRKGDHEFEFWPTEVKWNSIPDLSAKTLEGALELTSDSELDYVQRIYGPQTKTVQYVRTVRQDVN